MIKAIIFDFDGVILESANIKTESFKDMVSDYPEPIAKEFVEYHKQHMGISRFVKFRYFFEQILKEDYTKQIEEEWGERFRQITLNKVLNCPFVPGAEQFLKEHYEKKDLLLFVASGTPMQELKEEIVKRDLEPYFEGYYGTPNTKVEITNKILKQYKIMPDEAIFVGDASTDLQTAKSTGLYFVGRNTPDNRLAFADEAYKVDNLLQIDNIIQEIEGLR